jgi:hypothetical protein
MFPALRATARVRPIGVKLTIVERDCKGQPPFAGVRGVPEILLFLFLLAAAGGERGKEIQGTPLKPRQGDPALLKLTPIGRPVECRFIEHVVAPTQAR